MNKQELLTQYEQDARTKEIVSLSLEPKTKLFLSGIVASAGAFIAQAVINKSRNAHLFILNDATEAAYFQNDLRSLLTDIDDKNINSSVLFFPDSFKKSGHIHQINNANVQLRTECVNRITNPTAKAEIIVTYPEALFETVVKKTVLKKNMIKMAVGEKLDIDFMLELFIEYGFERTDFVYEPGQFAIRGDIVDVFSFANELPYRIELFDDEVESIRIFDPSTQLSETKIEKITIIPNVQTHFTATEKTSFFNILTPKTSVWVKSIPRIIDALDTNINKALEVYQEEGANKEDYTNQGNPFLESDPRSIFESTANVLNDMQKFTVIEFGSKSYFEEFEGKGESIEGKVEREKGKGESIEVRVEREKGKGESIEGRVEREKGKGESIEVRVEREKGKGESAEGKGGNEPTANSQQPKTKNQKQTTKIKYNFSHQTAFNKNFELLIKDLQNNQKAAIQNFLFAENPKQISRFDAIFDDMLSQPKAPDSYRGQQPKANSKQLEAKSQELWSSINTAIHEGFIDNDLKIAVYTDHQIFNRFHKFKLRQGYSKDKALILKTLKELKPGDFVTHIDHGVGRYSGLETIDVGGKKQECVRIIYAGEDLLYVGINSLHKISKFSGKEGQVPKIHKLGSDTWEKVKNKTKRKVKDIAKDLIKLYALRKSQKGFAFSKDNFMQTELEASFIYEDTPDQEKCTIDVKTDMEKPVPMDRLICGDVGFGKTEIAIRAAFKAVCDSKQVAILVPTTILAYQHYQTLTERLKDFPVTIDYINRFRTAKQKTQILKDLEAGKIDILIGTHGIVAKKVKYKDLGLLVVDEEQKFGVKVKDRLKEIKANVDTLTLTATPIPRTLQFSLMSARDLSIMETAPPNRQPVTTEVRVFNPELIKNAIEFEVYRGGQVFFVHTRIKDLDDLRAMIHRYLPDIDIAVAHGQMEGDKLETVMKDFVERKYDVLLSTNIIETGLDIPNANTIIINNAHMFGLSDLHQLRGRVGRSNKKAFAYLFSPPMSTLTKDARQRLKTVEEFSELGSGFRIAMRDLDIRGAGNLLGGEQSGFISDIGFETYHKILDEAIQELKETDFKELYKEELKEKRQYARDCQIDTDLEMLIPNTYINKINERMAIYTELNNLKNKEELTAFAKRLKDRFGDIPKQVVELFNGMEIKWLATTLGMERLWIKKGKMNCYFVQNQQSAFYSSEVFGKIIKYMGFMPQGVQMKEKGKYLIMTFSDLHSMEEAQGKLVELGEFVYS